LPGGRSHARVRQVRLGQRSGKTVTATQTWPHSRQRHSHATKRFLGTEASISIRPRAGETREVPSLWEGPQWPVEQPVTVAPKHGDPERLAGGAFLYAGDVFLQHYEARTFATIEEDPDPSRTRSLRAARKVGAEALVKVLGHADVSRVAGRVTERVHRVSNHLTIVGHWPHNSNMKNAAAAVFSRGSNDVILRGQRTDEHTKACDPSSIYRCCDECLRKAKAARQ
jgi:hypothetical protein